MASYAASGNTGDTPHDSLGAEIHQGRHLSNPSHRRDLVTTTVAAPPLATPPHERVASVSSRTPLLSNGHVPEDGPNTGVLAWIRRSKEIATATLESGNNGWWWELGGAFLGVSLVGAIVALLGGFDNRAEPQWWKGLKLTGVAAGFATVAKAASLLAVTTAISQLKWLWYREAPKGRRSADLELFDAASRGPWGSLTLMVQLRAWSFVLVGTTIVLASMLFEIAVQNSISNDIKRSFVSSETVTVPRLKQYTLSKYDGIESGDWRILASDRLARAASHGLYESTGKPNLGHHCPTESCMWPVFSSLGICSRCISIVKEVKEAQICTSDARWTSPKCHIELEGQSGIDIEFGYNGNGPGTHSNASAYRGGGSVGWYFGWGKYIWAGIRYPTTSFQNFEYKISHLPGDRFHIELLNATECAMYPCVKTYNFTVIDGTAHPNIISTWHNDSLSKSLPGSFQPPIYLDPPRHTNDSFLKGPYSLIGEAQQSIANFMSGQFKGLVSVSNTSNVFVSGDGGDLGWIYSLGDVSTVVENIAFALTDVIQTSRDNEPVLGLKSISEVYVHIRWGWLALPIALAIFSTFFLLVTMYTTKKSGANIWKSSSLPMLFHGLDRPPADEDFQLDDLNGMSRAADRLRLRLRRDETAAWRLVTSSAAR